MAQADLAIRGGTIVTADAEYTADIAIAGESIVQIGGDFEAAQTIDATGKLLFPGAIDAHVHLSQPPGPKDGPTWTDDFTSGSRGALAGGVTTLGNMSFLAPGETPLTGLNRERAVAAEQTIADVILHPVIMEPNQANLDDIPKLLAEGHNSIKYFISMPGFDPNVQGYLEATRRAGAEQLITLIHCEDYGMIEDATAQLLAAGKSSFKYYPESRPIVSEVVATQRAVAFAEATGAPVYIVHLSSKRSLEVCAEAQSRGVPVYVETRPLYLHLTRERFDEPDGAKYVGQPPLREQEDVDALWDGIRQGTLHTVCTDHAPWSLAAKLDPELTIAKLRPGVENLQTMVPMLYSEGVLKGRISLSRFVQVSSTNAAKLFGLYPKKGTIAIGSDADIIVFDPTITRTITNDMLLSNNDYSVYAGWEVTGWPTTTLRRGEIAYQDGQVLAASGSGRLLHRGPTHLL
jgi:dihydropyrimidinase